MVLLITGKLFSSKNEIYYLQYLIKVSFEFINVQNESYYALADAVSAVLSAYNIELLKFVHRSLVEGIEGEYNFSFPSLEPELAQRNISIILTFNKIRIIISGTEPVKGVSGDVKYFFDWYNCKEFNKNAEVIGLNDICKLPQVKKDSLIARIYEPVKGRAGVDVYGIRIPEKYITNVNVKFFDVYFNRHFNYESQRFVADVMANKNGAILCEFRRKRLSLVVSRVNIWSKITLKDTEINKYLFQTRPVKLLCCPEVEIEGNLTGNIIVDFEDNLSVRGTINCSGINVKNNLKANIVINTKINTDKAVDINSVNDSNINSKESIKIYKNLLNSTLKAKLVVIKSKQDLNILCTNSDIYADYVLMKGISIRNKIIIELGSDLFDKINKLKAGRELLEKESKELFLTIKTRILFINEKLNNFSSFEKETGLNTFNELKNTLSLMLEGNINSKVKEDIIVWIQRNHLDFYIISKSCLSLVSYIERYLTLKNEIDDLKNHLLLLNEDLKEIRVFIKGEITSNGSLMIKCDNYRIEKSQLSNLDVSLVYDVNEKKLVPAN